MREHVACRPRYLPHLYLRRRSASSDPWIRAGCMSSALTASWPLDANRGGSLGMAFLSNTLSAEGADSADTMMRREG